MGKQNVSFDISILGDLCVAHNFVGPSSDFAGLVMEIYLPSNPEFPIILLYYYEVEASSFWSIHVKPIRILCGCPRKREKVWKLSKKQKKYLAVIQWMVIIIDRIYFISKKLLTYANKELA